MRPKVIIIFGVGHHARRVYIPELLKNPELTNIKLVLVDLVQAAQNVEKYIRQSEYQGRLIPCYIENESVSDFGEMQISDELLRTYEIMGVIISTDPLNHMQYARWALRNNLHVLSDKPISTNLNSAHSAPAARKIYSDYRDLMSLYRRSKSMFCLSTQRRYETGYAFTQKLIREVTKLFGMPVTSIQAFYSDGLWIFPDEILHQKVHPFNQGYGMLSHSTFHILDAVWSFYKEGCIPEKMPDSIETFANATYPGGFLHNFSTLDYQRLFKKPVAKHDDAYYRKHMRGFGEMDVFASHLLKHKGEPVGAFSINMVHNGFSRRSREIPADDLYKGNGRVKHQCYIIEQGPFQSIQIHNYQAVSDHDNKTQDETYVLGGKNHFDIHVFRNAELFPEEEQPIRTYSSAEIDTFYKDNSSKLSNEIAKASMINEFISNCLSIAAGRKDRDSVEMRNGLASYDVPVRMMTDLYNSLALRNQESNPLVTATL